MTEHPSSLQLVQFSVDDLAPEAARQTREHVEACLACQAKLAKLSEERGALLARAPAAAFATSLHAQRSKVVQLKRRRVVVATLTTVFAAAAAIAFMLRPVERTGWKGGGLAIHRQRGGQVQVLTSADKIRAGDGLRIVVTSQRPERVTAWSLDAHGKLDRLTDHPLSLEAGEQVLPDSAIVDSPCVDLWMVVVSGEESDERVAAALRTAVSSGPPVGQDWLPAGAVVQALRCE